MPARNEFKDYYRILRIPYNASPDEIRAAYHQLARTFHPDAAGSNLFELQMKLINKAFSVLGNPEKKRYYDLIYRIRQQQSWEHAARKTSPEDPFTTYYRSRPYYKSPPPPRQEAAPAGRYPPTSKHKPGRQKANAAPFTNLGYASVMGLGIAFMSLFKAGTIFADIMVLLALAGYVIITAVEVSSWFGSGKRKTT